MIVCLKGLRTRLAAIALLAVAIVGAAAPAAAEQSCQEDFQRLSQQRMTYIEKLNAIGKAGKGKIDPMAACPVARGLVGVENALLAYMTKNKEWCSIPDQVIAQFQQARGRDQNFASQACAAAAKFKEMQAQQRAAQANGGMPAPPKLPAGPL